MIAFRPAALSFRFLRGTLDEATPACFLDAAHLFRWAAAILARAAADIRCLTGMGALPSAALGLNIWRSSAICALSRFFCSSKPAMAAVRIWVVSFEGMLGSDHCTPGAIGGGRDCDIDDCWSELAEAGYRFKVS